MIFFAKTQDKDALAALSAAVLPFRHLNEDEFLDAQRVRNGAANGAAMDRRAVGVAA
jgi:hypothetical protein